MKTIFTALLLTCACFFTPLPAQEKAYRTQDIPMVHLQDRTRYVCNPDNVLGRAAVAQMDSTLYGLEKRTGAQVLVVAVKQIEGGDCFDFAYRLGRENGVGQKGKDNGLVILLVTGERCIQFATGYGLEGVLPDAACKQIQARYMNPHFKRGDWDGGMLAGIRMVSARLDGTGEPLSPQDGGKEGSMLLLAVLICCFVLVPALLWLNIRQRKRCPACHKHTLNPLSIRTVLRENGYRTEEIVYRCSHCGYTKRRTRRTRDHDDFHHRGGNGWPFLGGPFIGGGFGGGSGSGGFGGGDFGGGDFGGGGAGSRF